MDRDTIGHALAMAKIHGARIYLLHVEEGVTSQVYGNQSATSEVAAGERYLDRIADTARSQGVEVEAVVRHAAQPPRAIIEFAREIQPDLVVMGAHGHRGLKDLIFGTTINAVRHALDVPLLIVRKES
jgi:manganese transport protein